MKTFIKTTIIILSVTCFNIKSNAQYSVSITADSRCESAATLQATTTGGLVEQLRWQWKSRNDSLVSTKTISPVYDSGFTVAGGNGEGDNSNQVNGPWGFCVDKWGNVYIADTYNDRVQKWLPGAKEGITVAGGNGKGSEPNQLNEPYDVKVDNDGNIYISDNQNYRIQKWTFGASEGVTVAGGNGYGNDANQLYFAEGIALDKENNIYIADKGNHRIQKWLPGAKEGITVAGGNGAGSAANQTPYPKGVFVDTAGNIYVTGDGYYTNRVQKWMPGAKEGITVAGGILKGICSNEFRSPHNIFVDHLGNLYVADQLNDRIQKYLPELDTAVTVVGFSEGSGPEQLYNPSAVWVLGDTIYVCDQGNNRVQQFISKSTGPIIETSFKPENGGNYRVTALFKQNYQSATSNTVHVKGLPKFTTIKGQKRNLCGGGNFVYSADALGEADSYNWVAPAGCTIVSGQGTSSVTLSIPANFSSGSIGVSATNKCGTGPVFYDTLTTKPAQPGGITGPSTVGNNDTVIYSIDPEPGISYRWEIPVRGVVIVSGQNTNSITVAWNSFFDGNVIAKASACAGGTESSSRLFVTSVPAIVAANTDAIQTKTAGSYLKVYPNPANNTATVAFTAAGEYILQVRDMAGKLLFSKKAFATKGKNIIDIDISRFSKGNYFVTLLDNNGKKVVQLSKE